jgi:hypothetical protein
MWMALAFLGALMAVLGGVFTLMMAFADEVLPSFFWKNFMRTLLFIVLGLATFLGGFALAIFSVQKYMGFY